MSAILTVPPALAVSVAASTEVEWASKTALLGGYVCHFS